MRTLPRSISLAAVALALFTALPAFAQNSFEGLDLSSQSKTKKKKKPRKKQAKRRTRGQQDTAAAAASQKETAKETAPPGRGPATELKQAVSTPPVETPRPEITKKPEPIPKPAATLTFEAVDLTGKSAERQRLDVAVQQFKQEQYELAAMTSYELMRDPKLLGLQLDAHYVLAKSLYRMGMYHSSLGEFSKILGKGPQTKFFKNGLEWLFFISHKTTNEAVILEEIAKYSNFEFPQRFRGEFRYLLARYHFVRGKALDAIDQRGEANKSFDQVKALILTVPKGDPFYARAKYLEGLAYFREDNSQAALESMKEVVRITRPNSNKSEVEAKLDKDLRQLAFMQLARTHYGHRQNRNAIYYYGKVERGGKQWLESLFESAWANYRVAQYEQSLGNLITLSAPFFRDEYFPEALILKAVIYYENCRYREARSTLEDFEKIYLPVHDQLEAMTKNEKDSSEYYQILSEIQKKSRTHLAKSNTDAILDKILRLALTDKDFKNTNDSILELESEVDSIGKRGDTFRYSDLAKTLLEGLKAERQGLVKRAGIMAKGKLETELAELKRLLTNGLRIKFETTTKEKEFLEDQLRAGGRQEIVKKYRYSVAVSDEQLYWPYEGEYWRDELGTYQYTLTKGCAERQALAGSGG
jgi:tetratricopeptide (TPR) repeat protein